DDLDIEIGHHQSGGVDAALLNDRHVVQSSFGAGAADAVPTRTTLAACSLLRIAAMRAASVIASPRARPPNGLTTTRCMSMVTPVLCGKILCGKILGIQRQRAEQHRGL